MYKYEYRKGHIAIRVPLFKKLKEARYPSPAFHRQMGGLAGAVYAIDGIPKDRLATFVRRTDTGILCKRAWQAWL